MYSCCVSKTIAGWGVQATCNLDWLAAVQVSPDSTPNPSDREMGTPLIPSLPCVHSWAVIMLSWNALYHENEFGLKLPDA